MNVWTLRSKLKATTLASEVCSNASVPTEAATTVITPPPVVTELPEFIGLDQVFEMTDSDLRRISPKATYSQFKKLRTVEPQVEIPSVPACQPVPRTELHVGLDALLTMDSEQVERLFS